MFWPTFSCQILKSLSQGNGLQKFCKDIFANYLHVIKFLNFTSGCLKFGKNFCILEMAWSRAFQKCIFHHFLDIILCIHFYHLTWFCRKFQFWLIFLQILKVEHKTFPFVTFAHQTWDLEGKRGKIAPSPQRILVFKYPSKDRVKIIYS